MTDLFSSRSAARKAAAEKGMKVVDRGTSPAVVATGRWMLVPKNTPKRDWVVPTDSTPVQAPPEATGDMASQYFASRGKAREFAKTKKNAKIIDHAKGKYTVDYKKAKALGKEKRWEVQYSDTSLAASHEDMKVYNKISSDYLDERNGNNEEPVPEETPISEPVVIMTMKSLSVMLPMGKQLLMDRSHKDFKTCAALFTEGEIDKMIEIMDVDKKPREWRFGNDIQVIEGVLYHYGMEVENTSLVTRIINDCTEEKDPTKYANFFRKLMQNPSYLSVKHAYAFLQHNDLEILENGDIKAWKKVTADGKARGGVPNYKGTHLAMPRNMVEDNPNKTCSAGLHAAAKEYFNHHFEEEKYILIEIAVNPRDIVSVPVDYGDSKCRTCGYEVLTGVEPPEGAPKYLLVGEGGAILKFGNKPEDILIYNEEGEEEEQED